MPTRLRADQSRVATQRVPLTGTGKGEPSCLPARQAGDAHALCTIFEVMERLSQAIHREETHVLANLLVRLRDGCSG